MIFLVENKHLEINEEDIRKCEDLKSLRNWKQEITKQVIVMDNKIRGLEIQDLITPQETLNKNSTIHAKQLQDYLIMVINDRIDELKEARKYNMEALYFTYAESDLPEELHNAVYKKAEKALKEGHM